ncbi:tRNA1(Val) (adenine(37)-N6)-methyltransferase [Dysgonomonas sp. ZJ279]|uniref:tRNA1(Val) (adenine(37)-N6)-methyltransferase n=1 Tax=Dysgonomonas sp. ZJ279 TaxID=2709796 RepID=UPI0013ED1CE8|nr:methyltransferase [Dysgonomonas sp. ZJ279]
MANPYFQFKQFTVYHDRCAMKVGTDGTLLGAWTKLEGAKRILDVGTGSGLISLMLAQRKNDTEIDAIDTDTDAVEQANDNIKQSPFFKLIKCQHISFQDFAKRNSIKYDVIVSNPPFFLQSLKSPDKQRTLARHTDSLYIEELIALSSKHLADNGHLSIIFPYEQKNTLITLAAKSGLYISHITNIFPTPMSTAKRVLMEFSKANIPLVEDDLVIEKERHVYTDDFKNLTKDFYLKL